jgi:hypothetical protein
VTITPPQPTGFDTSEFEVESAQTPKPTLRNSNRPGRTAQLGVSILSAVQIATNAASDEQKARREGESDFPCFVGTC